MSIFNLKNTIGREFDMPVDDQALTKKALLHLGYEDATPDLVTPYVGNQSFDGLMGFQKDQGLKIDGIARPDGPTARGLDRELTRIGAGAGDIDPATPFSGKPRIELAEGPTAPLARPPAAAFVPPTRPTVTPPVYRGEVLNRQKGVWPKWQGAVDTLPGMTEAERRTDLEIFAAEGGRKDDPTSSASSGIMPDTSAVPSRPAYCHPVNSINAPTS